MTREELEKIQKAAEPLMKLLCKEYHPHHTVIVTGTSVELLESVGANPKIYDFVED